MSQKVFQGAATRQGHFATHDQITKQNLIAASNAEVAQIAHQELHLNLFYDDISIPDNTQSLDDLLDIPTQDYQHLQDFNEEMFMPKSSGDGAGFEIPDDRNSAFKTSKNEVEELIKQASTLKLTSGEIEISTYLIQSMDGDGFITNEGESRELDSVYANLAKAGFSKFEVQSVHDKLKMNLLPSGILSANFQDSLITQIQRMPRNSENMIMEKIIRDDYDSFKKDDVDSLQRKYKLGDSNVLDKVFGVLKGLNPRPLHTKENSSPLKSFSKEPDFVVTLDKGAFKAKSTADFKIQVNKNSVYLRELLKFENDPKKKDLVAFYKAEIAKVDQFNKNLAESLANKEQVISYLCNFQREFIESNNVDKIKPILRKDLAEMHNMDPSTISRVLKDKVIELPNGVRFEARSLSDRGIASSNSIARTPHEIKDVIRNIIDNNESGNLSSAVLRDKLKEQKVEIGILHLNMLRSNMDDKYQFKAGISNKPGKGFSPGHTQELQHQPS